MLKLVKLCAVAAAALVANAPLAAAETEAPAAETFEFQAEVNRLMGLTYEQRGLAPNSTKAATARGLEVCVVGNGPLSSKDREFINSTKCDEVWRFNDMKNFRKGERVDGHIVRSNGRGGSGYHGLNKRTEKKLSSLDWSAVKRMYMGGPKGDIDAHGHKIDAHGYIYPSCHKKKSRAASAFTSGATALSYFEGRDDVDSINVLGMNFLPGRAKHERGEKKIIEKCCTKCHVRKPPKNTYAP